MAVPDIALVSVQQLIVHVIPKNYKAGPNQTLDLSEGVSSLDDGLKGYIKDKIIQGVGNRRAMLAAWSPDLDGSLKNTVETLLDGGIRETSNFVSCSQQFAKILHSVQTGSAAEGVLLVVRISIGGIDGLCLMKLDSQRGVRLLDPSTEGPRTYSLEEIKNLVMSDDTRLQKFGMFVRDPDAEDGICIKICDMLIGDLSGGETASFWRRFLGVHVAVGQPPVATRRFKEETEAFINDSAPDGPTRAEWIQGLQSYLRGQEPNINIQSFANRTFPEGIRDDYAERLNNVGFADHDFLKDTSHVRSQLAFMRMPLNTGVVVLAPNDKFKTHVKVNQLDNGEVEIVTRGVLMNVDGKRRA